MSAFSTPGRPSAAERRAVRDAEAGALAEFALATYVTGGQERVGFVVGERVIEANRALAAWSRAAQRPIGGLLPVTSMHYLLERWEAYDLVLRHTAVLLRAGASLEADFEPLSHAALLPPVPRPGKIVNLVVPALDIPERGVSLPEGFVPLAFYKGGRDSVTGPEQPVMLASDRVGCEARLAAVIGRTARRVPVEKALEHVAGYTCHNDVTDHQALVRPDGAYDWLAGKARDTFAPLGPFLVPRYLVQQPESLRVRGLVNGELRQDYTVGQLHWSVARCISHLSGLLTLQPGDVIGLGPEATGAAYLRSGDRLSVQIEGLGALENLVA